MPEVFFASLPVISLLPLVDGVIDFEGSTLKLLGK
jgi:hypothetical protein